MHKGFKFCFMVLEGSVSSSLWNEIKKIEKKILCYHLGVQSTTLSSVMFPETGRPIDFYAHQRVKSLILKIWMEKQISSFILVQDSRKWFARWQGTSEHDYSVLLNNIGNPSHVREDSLKQISPP